MNPTVGDVISLLWNYPVWFVAACAGVALGVVAIVASLLLIGFDEVFRRLTGL